jgi:hypothetical protein
LDAALALLRRTCGRFPFDRLVSHMYPRERIFDAFRALD